MDKKWEEMTPEEKREVRFKRWLDAENVQFISSEAKEKYQERVEHNKAVVGQRYSREALIATFENFLNVLREM